MATLSNGRIVHASRLDAGGDLHDKIGESLKVVNRWIKRRDNDEKLKDARRKARKN